MATMALPLTVLGPKGLTDSSRSDQLHKDSKYKGENANELSKVKGCCRFASAKLGSANVMRPP